MKKKNYIKWMKQTRDANWKEKMNPVERNDWRQLQSQ